MKKTIFYIFVTILITSCSGLTPASSPTGPKTAEEYFERGNEFYSKENYANALADYNKVIELDPTIAGAYFGRGLVYSRTARTVDEHKEAIREFKRVLEINPNYSRAADVNAAIGALYFDMDDNKNARIYINKALEIENDNEVALAVIKLIEEEEAASRAKLELQKTFDKQFGRIDKTLYEEMGEGAGMAALLGMGSPYKTGKKYKVPVMMGMNTQYGATFTDATTGFVDSQKRVPDQLIGYNVKYYIYFTVSRITRDGIYINLEYIEL